MAVPTLVLSALTFYVRRWSWTFGAMMAIWPMLSGEFERCAPGTPNCLTPTSGFVTGLVFAGITGVVYRLNARARSNDEAWAKERP